MKTKKAAAQQEERMAFEKSKLEWDRERVAKELEMRKDELKGARLEREARQKAEDEEKNIRVEREEREDRGEERQQRQESHMAMMQMLQSFEQNMPKNNNSNKTHRALVTRNMKF